MSQADGMHEVLYEVAQRHEEVVAELMEASEQARAIAEQIIELAALLPKGDNATRDELIERFGMISNRLYAECEQLGAASEGYTEALERI